MFEYVTGNAVEENLKWYIYIYVDIKKYCSNLQSLQNQTWKVGGGAPGMDTPIPALYWFRPGLREIPIPEGFEILSDTKVKLRRHQRWQKKLIKKVNGWKSALQWRWKDTGNVGARTLQKGARMRTTAPWHCIRPAEGSHPAEDTRLLHTLLHHSTPFLQTGFGIEEQMVAIL